MGSRLWLMYGADALVLLLDQSVFSIRMRNTVWLAPDGRVVVRAGVRGDGGQVVVDVRGRRAVLDARPVGVLHQDEEHRLDGPRRPRGRGGRAGRGCRGRADIASPISGAAGAAHGCALLAFGARQHEPLAGESSA